MVKGGLQFQFLCSHKWGLAAVRQLWPQLGERGVCGRMCVCVSVEANRCVMTWFHARSNSSPVTPWSNSFLFILISDQLLSIFHASSKVAIKDSEPTLLCSGEELFARMLRVTRMTSMTVDYPTRLVFTAPRGRSVLMGTTQACIMRDIMCSCLTAVVAHRYKEHYSATGSTAHAPEQFGLVMKRPK